MGKERFRTGLTAIVRVKWLSRTAGFAHGSVESIIQKACKHFRLGAIQSDLVLLGELDGEQLEVTDDLLGLLPKGMTLTLSRVQQEDAPHVQASIDHACSDDELGNRTCSSGGPSRVPRAPGMFVFIAPLVGTKFTLECEHLDTIDYIKDQIAERTGMSPTRQRLLFRGRQLEEGRTLSDYDIQKENTLHLAARQVGGKPVIHLFPPTPNSRRDASKQVEDGQQRVTWSVAAHPDGTLVEKGSGLELSYLFWEAESNASLPRSPPLNPLLPYLDGTLKLLSLHTSARNDFITYWLPKLAKKPFVALRFLPQAAYEGAAKLGVEPAPDVVTRVFMRGISADDAEGPAWSAARARVREVDWVKVVGVEDGAWDESRFRVLEWGGMEVL
ncbi:hypothetical protein GSI_08623 [Ganoderma sinense ZZ0214-1]|uniref:Ubiquitin-like domain-containing protein n=1 Tax=Ganoderma sinense ZZ0214-1 TaxID=1077348 RepID=A0A2G8S487_9APHY|nr:hypothetical protein GSI_08623 [Ganoderma sinense ZZ0214-1]